MTLVIPLDFDSAILQPVLEVRRGKTCFIVHSEKLGEILRQRFGRKGLCLKVFSKVLHTQTEIRDPDKYFWAMGISLTESTKVQNLFAFEDFAPRVYSIVLVNNRFLAQVTDFVKGMARPITNKVLKLMKKYSLALKESYGKHGFDSHEWNWMGNKLVDFGGFCFHDPKGYEKGLVERSKILMRQWKILNTARAYQDIPELNIAGLRGPTDERFKLMQLNRIDFQGKTVLDLGCNLGAFCRKAEASGAQRIIGVDIPEIAGVAQEIANWLGFWNSDFLGLSLPDEYNQIRQETGIEKFDIVFALSIVGHVRGYAAWIPALCKSLFFLEAHAKDSVPIYTKKLEKDFRKVEYLGMTRDSGVRPVFRCRK